MPHQTRTGIQLAKQSLAILKQKKSLLIFPLLGTLLVVIAFVVGLTPLLKIETAAWTHPTALSKTTFVVFYLILFALFFVAHLLTILFNAGLIVCTIKHMKNEPYTIITGFKIILFRFPFLCLWTMLMTSFGAFVRIVEYWSDHWPNSKTATDTLAGLPWLMATFLMTPVLIIENINPWHAIKRSAQLFKNTWGTAVVSKTSIGIITFPLRIVAFLPLVITVFIGGKMALIIGSTISSILFFSISTVVSALQCMLTGALYVHANNINLSAFYDIELLKNAFCTVKKHQ